MSPVYKALLHLGKQSSMVKKCHNKWIHFTINEEVKLNSNLYSGPNLERLLSRAPIGSDDLPASERWSFGFRWQMGFWTVSICQIPSDPSAVYWQMGPHDYLTNLHVLLYSFDSEIWKLFANSTSMPEHNWKDPSKILSEGSKCNRKRKNTKQETSGDEFEEISRPPPAKHAAAPRKSSTTNPPMQSSKNLPSSHTPPPASTPNQPAEVIEIEDVDEKATSLKHQLLMVGQPSTSCIADHPQFTTKDSLTYTFLIMSKPEYGEDGTKLISCEMACTLCYSTGITKFWKWSAKNRGSIGNFISHFESKHTRFWNTWCAEDKAVQYSNQTVAVGENSSQPTLHAWADKAS